MPRISSFYGIEIFMYAGDHMPPHFHASYAEFSAAFSISNLGILSGKLPPKAIALVVEWASLHEQELMNNWDRLTKIEKPNQIEPLK